MTDKIKHIICCFAITLGVGFLFGSLSLGMIAAAIAGLAKELWDYLTAKGCADWDDWNADCVGIFLGSLVYSLIFGL